ncbi:MAG: hypothetical protein HY040_18375 [Planctomycetes bacterium]|nr:hypothetical protein [Planctomycetota bacterium]
MELFFDTLSRPNGALLIPITLFVVMGVASIIIGGLGQWRKHRQTEVEAKLIQDMLQRGMSAEEIATVLHAAHMKGPKLKEMMAARPPFVRR